MDAEVRAHRSLFRSYFQLATNTADTTDKTAAIKGIKIFFEQLTAQDQTEKININGTEIPLSELSAKEIRLYVKFTGIILQKIEAKTAEMDDIARSATALQKQFSRDDKLYRALNEVKDQIFLKPEFVVSTESAEEKQLAQIIDGERPTLNQLHERKEMTKQVSRRAKLISRITIPTGIALGIGGCIAAIALIAFPPLGIAVGIAALFIGVGIAIAGGASAIRANHEDFAMQQRLNQKRNQLEKLHNYKPFLISETFKQFCKDTYGRTSELNLSDADLVKVLELHSERLKFIELSKQKEPWVDYLKNSAKNNIINLRLSLNLPEDPLFKQ